MSFKTKFVFVAIILFFSVKISFSQDFQPTVKINADKVQLTDKTVFKNMEKSVFEFLNSRKWSNDKVLTDEKLNITFFFIIETYEAPDNFTGSLQVQSSRPVYNSSYNSVMLNLKDENLTFKYSDLTVFDYQENQFVNNLSAVLSFYVYIMLGIDYDSYAPDGGSVYFTKAQQIVNSAQTATEPGWQAFDSKGNKNRYWLIENLLNARYKPFHEAIYTYHRKGMDQMSKKLDAGRDEIYNALESVKKVFKLSPSLYLLTIFFTAKSEEIVNIYKDANQQDKSKVVELLNEINNQNSTKWNTIITK